MLRTAPGRPVGEVEDEYREIIARHGLRGIDDYMIGTTARTMVDARWARHHPFSAVAFVWRHRKGRSFFRALRGMWRPRFGG
jgi:hypothetical protein